MREADTKSPRVRMEEEQVINKSALIPVQKGRKKIGPMKMNRRIAEMKIRKSTKKIRGGKTELRNRQNVKLKKKMG